MPVPVSMIGDQLLARLFGYCRESEDRQFDHDGTVTVDFTYRGRRVSLRMVLRREPTLEGKAVRRESKPGA